MTRLQARDDELRARSQRPLLTAQRRTDRVNWQLRLVTARADRRIIESDPNARPRAYPARAAQAPAPSSLTRSKQDPP